MIDPKHLVRYVIRPVLKDLELWSEAAEQLVLGTACVESECGHYLAQLGNVQGGGRGIYQMEEKTEYDLVKNYIRYRMDLHQKMMRYPRYVELYEQIRLEEIQGTSEGEKKS
jgi:hypothetical protein